MNQVLDKCGLLQIRTLALAWISAREAERQRRIGIELRRVSDQVSEILVQKRVVRFNADFPLVPAVSNRDRSLEISLVEPIVLEQDDGCRKVIRIKVVGIVPNHPAKISDHIGRENMPVGGN